MIKTEEYKLIADNLGNSEDYSILMYNAMGQMMTHLEANEVSNNNTDKLSLLRTISSTYQLIFNKHVSNTTVLIQMVQSLQKHVVFRFKDINIYLSANNIKVNQSFANLSFSAGFEISPQNIE